MCELESWANLLETLGECDKGACKVWILLQKGTFDENFKGANALLNGRDDLTHRSPSPCIEVVGMIFGYLYRYTVWQPLGVWYETVDGC
mmetsp:Transcript_16846/g.28915  ORF Transcript_16846/g.28915 Transcript_16846/m.28915 type:complete len:89 (+) Transcript_16846:614-880(+)